MAEISWIKLKTDMFDNDKIKLIEALPEGDTILVVWIKLLVHAGKTNANGYILINETIALTDEDMAIIFGRSLHVIRLSLQVFERYGMITVLNDQIRIKNWDVYQNVDGMEMAKIKTRNRVKRHRERKKLELAQLLEQDESSNVTVTLRNGYKELELDLERDKDKEIKDKEIKTVTKPKPKTKNPKAKEPKIQYAEFVSMTEKEYSTLATTHGIDAAQSMITILDNYKGASGKKYASDYRAILNWVVKRYNEDLEKQTKRPTNRHDEFQQLREELLNNDGQATNFIDHPVNNDILSKPKN